MDMEKVVNIDGKQIGFRSTGATVAYYRHKFGSDFISDIKRIQEAMNSKEGFKALDLECFEHIAFIMAWQYSTVKDVEGREPIPDDPDEWLDTFETFSVYQVFPEIISLWMDNSKTTSIPKKG